MAILETFYLLFKTDTKDLKKGSEEAKKEADKLESSFNNVSKASGQMKSAIVGVGASLAGLAAGLISVGLVTRSLASAIDYTQQIGEASRALNVNASELDAWGNAVQRTGGTAAQFQQSLKSLAEHLGTTPQGAMSVLPKLADSFERLGRNRSLQYGKMLGLDEATIRLLQQGRQELELNLARQKELGVITHEDTEIAKKYNDAIFQSQHAWRSLFVTLGLDALPALTKVIDVFTKIGVSLREHKDLVIGALIAIGAVGAVIATPFIIASAPILGIMTLIGGLIALFAIVYEDIRAFMQGNSSLIGDLLKQWPVVGKVVSDVVLYWKSLFAGLLQVIETVTNAFGKVSNFFKGGSSLGSAQIALSAANLAPVNTQARNNILGAASLSRTNSISTGDIIINTQATDSEGIRQSFQRELQSHFWQSNSNFDDGVRI